MKAPPLFASVRSKYQNHRRRTMKGRPILIRMLVLGLMLALTAGLTLAQ